MKSNKIIIYLSIGLFAAVLLFLATVLFQKTSSRRHDWLLQSTPPDNVDYTNAHLDPDGNFIAWSDSNHRLFGVFEIGIGGRQFCFESQSALAVRVGGFAGRNLLVLRATKSSESFLTTGNQQTKESVQTFLDYFDLQSPELLSSVPGQTIPVIDSVELVNDFSVGQIGYSRKHDRIVWWQLGEEVFVDGDKDGLHEQLRTMRGAGLSEISNLAINSDGHLAIRTPYMLSMGKGFWLDADYFMFTSFVDKGSVILLNDKSQIVAKRSIVNLQTEAAGHFSLDDSIFQIEGCGVVQNATGGQLVPCFWSWGEETLDFSITDRDLTVQAVHQFQSDDFERGTEQWLPYGECLVVAALERKQLLMIDPLTGPKDAMALPPDWGVGSFRLLGTDAENNLWGHTNSAFYCCDAQTKQWESVVTPTLVE